MDDPFRLFAVLFLLAMANLFFPPIPLEMMTLFAGYLSGAAHGSIFIVITATTAGTFCSNLILFEIVKSKGINVLRRTPLQKFITARSYDRAVGWFNQYGIYAVFLGKLVPGMSLAAVICCGVFRWERKIAALAFFGSNLLFFGGLSLTGRVLGVYWNRALPWLTQIGTVMTFLAIALVVFQIFRSFILKKTKRRN